MSADPDAQPWNLRVVKDPLGQRFVAVVDKIADRLNDPIRELEYRLPAIGF